MKKIVFVCSGNTCRSPIAEGIAKKVFPEKFPEEIRISSAGISAVDGLTASGGAIEVAARHSIDLSAHRSRRLSDELIREADLIVVMTVQHRDAVVAIEPSAAEYTRLLGGFGGGKEVEIGDPVGGGADVYDRTFETIERYIRAMGDELAGFDGWKKR